MGRGIAGWIVFGMAVALATPACAQDSGLSASATVASDYRFRGISLSDRDPVIQAAVEYETHGIRAGVWASTLGGNTRLKDSEVDLYAGYTHRSGGWRYTATAYAYQYPGASGFSYAEVQGEIGYAIGPAEARAFAAYSPDQFGMGSDNLYVGAGLNAGVPGTPFSLSAKGGYEDGFYEKKIDWQVDVTWTTGPFNAGLAYVDTSKRTHDRYGRLGAANVVASAGISF